MQPTPTRPPAAGRRRHLGSALTAVALIAAVLAPVALSAVPAAAHTQQVERCSYDPFAGQQCWNEDVAHVHRPNHYSPPPDTSPRPDPDPADSEESENDEQDSSGGTDTSSSSDSGSGTDDEREGDDGQADNDAQDSNDGTTPSNQPNHYSPPPDTSPRPSEPDHDNQQSDDTTSSDTSSSSGDSGSDPDDDSCTSGTFVSGNCQPRPEGSHSGSEEDDDEGEDGDSTRPGRCDTHPPQAGCPQQDSGSQSNQRDEQNSQNQQDTSTERDGITEVVCTVAGQRDARVDFACDSLGLIVNREVDAQEGNPHSTADDIYAIGSQIACSIAWTGGVVSGSPAKGLCSSRRLSWKALLTG